MCMVIKVNDPRIIYIKEKRWKSSEVEQSLFCITIPLVTIEKAFMGLGSFNSS